jgi:dTDP-4-amino-4,6-dideoxygalactose transaminase
MYKGKKAGSLTDVSVFSFHAVKNLTTAEGGAVALNLPGPFDNTDIYSRLCVKSLHGQNKDALAKMNAGNWKYDIVEAGYKMNMTDIQASIGLVELERYDSDTLLRRKAICSAYTKEFNKMEWAIIPVQENANLQAQSSFHLFALRIKGISENDRDAIISNIAQNGVSVNVHFIPVPLMSFYRNLGYDMNNYPNAYELYKNEITLPVYYDLTDEQVKTVVNTVCKAVEEQLKITQK